MKKEMASGRKTYAMAPLCHGPGAGKHYRRHLFRWGWVAGEVMAGVIGALTIGGALYLSQELSPHDKNSQDDSSLQAYDNQTELLSRERLLSGQKGNQLVIHIPRQAVRRRLDIRATRSVDGQEVMIVEPHMLVKTGMVLEKTSVSDKLPPFDPASIMRKGIDVEPDHQSASLQGAASQSSFKLYDLPMASLIQGDDRPDEDSLQSVAQAALINGTASAPDDSHYVSFSEESLSSEGTYSDSADQTVSLNPLNVIALAPVRKKTAEESFKLSEALYVFKEDGSLFPALKELGIEADEDIIPAMNRAVPLLSIKKGWVLKVGFLEEAYSENRLPYALAIYKHHKRVGAIKIKDDRTYEVLDDEEEVFPELRDDQAPSLVSDNLTFYQSLYETGAIRNIPRPVIDQLVAIFVYDTDMKKRVSSSDHLEVMYTEPEAEGGVKGFHPEVVFASLKQNGVLRTYYLFRDKETGKSGYFDDSGQSARKFLLRKPLAYGEFRSGFGMRRHPLSKVMKMHTGVDWAARTGTPIYAAGNGIIDYAKWKTGYGNHIRIRHANGYTTTYSHMSRFASGIREGARVKLGQEIGFVGSTGLSTGAHLHYEVLINDKFVDPAKINVPRGTSLTPSEKTRFDTMVKTLEDNLESSS